MHKSQLYILSIFLLALPTLSFGNCEEFLDQKLLDMGMGSLVTPSLGVDKNTEKPGRILLSRSTIRGQKDPGPTIAMYDKGPNKIKITQIKNITETRTKKEKYYFIFGSNCKNLKSLKAYISPVQAELTPDKCKNQKINFLKEQLDSLPIKNLCQAYFNSSESSESNVEDSSIKAINN